MYRSLTLLCLVISGLWHGAANALPDDKLQAMHLSADSVKIDDAAGVTTYQGNVVLTQGSLKLEADTITIERLNRGENITAIGNPARFEQLPKLDGDLAHGTSLQMEYRSKPGVLLLIDEAEVHQGRNSFRNDRIQFDTNQSTVKAGQVTQGQERVQSIILPRDPAPTPAP